MTAVKLQETETEQIAQLESEIVTRSIDIERLREAIATLEAGKLRPVNPSADSAFTLLVELVGAAPQGLEDRQVYNAKLEAARLSLKLAIEICEQKQTELKLLQQANRSQQSDVLLQELLAKAEKYNAAIDESFALLEQMKLLSSEITQLRGDRISRIEIVADLDETGYFQILGDRIRLRRRFDVKRG